VLIKIANIANISSASYFPAIQYELPGLTYFFNSLHTLISLFHLWQLKYFSISVLLFHLWQLKFFSVCYYWRIVLKVVLYFEFIKIYRMDKLWKSWLLINISICILEEYNKICFYSVTVSEQILLYVNIMNKSGN
jgi:hypothetical protein